MDTPDPYSRVCIGTKVTVLCPDGTEKTYAIKNTREANPHIGIISDVCPMGKALVGSRVGDSVSYSVGEKRFTVKILSVAE